MDCEQPTRRSFLATLGAFMVAPLAMLTRPEPEVKPARGADLIHVSFDYDYDETVSIVYGMCH